jgi:hypothetical protein
MPVNGICFGKQWLKAKDSSTFSQEEREYHLSRGRIVGVILVVSVFEVEGLLTFR